MSRFSIFFAGDNLARASHKGKDPYEFVRPAIKTCQAAFCNLETVLTDHREKAAGTVFNICTGAENLAHMTRPGGFDAVTLANNHILDYGPGGLADTIALLDRAGIIHTGAGFSREEALRPAVVEICGVKVAFIGMSKTGSMVKADAHVLPLDLETAREAIGIARRAGASVVICSPHWGRELAYFPTPDQQAFGRGLIDAGADLVVGHHPHVIQGVETYRDKLIFYSLGNFNFPCVMISRKNPDKLGAVLRVVFRGNTVDSHEITPVRINDYWQPVPLDAEKVKLFRRWTGELSEPLAGGVSWQWWRRQVGWATFRRRVSARRTIIARAQGTRQKLRAIGGFLAWFLSPKCLRWFLAAFLKSFVFHRKQRYIPPEEFR